MSETGDYDTPKRPLDGSSQIPDEAQDPGLRQAGDASAAVNAQTTPDDGSPEPPSWGYDASASASDGEEQPRAASSGGSGGDKPPDLPRRGISPGDGEGDGEQGKKSERFAGEAPTLEEARQAQTFYNSGTIRLLRKHAKDADVLTVRGSRMANLALESPRGGAFFEAHFEEGSGVQIADSVVVPEGLQEGTEGEDPRRLYVYVRHPDTSETHQVYYKDKQGLVRRRDYNPGAVYAGIPPEGQVPDRIRLERLYDLYKEDQKNLETERKLGLHPIVGPAEIEHVLELALQARPERISADTLIQIADLRANSFPLTRADSTNGARDFTRMIGEYLSAKRKEHNPFDPRETVLHKHVSHPEGALEVYAGVALDASTGMETPRVRIESRLRVPLEQLRIKHPTVAAFQRFGPIEYGSLNTHLDYRIHKGELRSSVARWVFSDSGRRLASFAPMEARADTLEARRLRAFLMRGPLLKR